MAESPAMLPEAFERLRDQQHELLGEYFKQPAGQDENPPVPLRTPVFTRVMRGFDPHQVDEFLSKLALNPRLDAPAFALVMRGYAMAEVTSFINQIKAANAEDWWQALSSPSGGWPSLVGRQLARRAVDHRRCLRLGRKRNSSQARSVANAQSIRDARNTCHLLSATPLLIH